MTQIDCSDKHILIVENIKQSRDTLKLFTYGVGAVHVDIAQRASNVISMCEYTKYDVIFLGYDLGENKKNGQQILEELRLKGLISRHCIIIMITAEVSQGMVLAALEHKPDEYLAKPYSLKDIKTRLSRCLTKKKAMGKIYQAMDDNDHELVLSLTATEIQKGNAYKSECLGIISRQYFELKEFDKASKIYNEYKDIPNCQWAQMGLGKIALAQNKLADARVSFQAIIDQYPLYLSAYDWLSKTLELQDQHKAAEEVLENAIFISPRSVLRLKKYASLCLDNESYDKATQAYYKSNELSQHSVHKNPELAILFAESLLEYADDLDPQETKKLTNKAHKALNTMSKEFSQPEFKIISNLLSSRLFDKNDSTSLSKPLTSNAIALLNQHRGDIPGSQALTISSSLLSLDKKLEAKALLNDVAASHPDDINMLAKVEGLLDRPIDESQKLEAQESLEKGMALYKQKKYNAAIEKLNHALNLFPGHIGIKLNLLQALVVVIKLKKAKTKDFVQTNNILLEFDEMELEASNETFRRYTKLKETYQKIKSLET